MKSEREVEKRIAFYANAIKTCPKGCEREDITSCWICASAKKYIFALAWVLKSKPNRLRRSVAQARS